MDNIALLRDLILRVDDLQYGDASSVDAVKRRAEMLIRNVLHKNRTYLESLSKIHFGYHLRVVTGTNNPDLEAIRIREEEIEKKKEFELEKKRLKNLIENIVDELNLFGDNAIKATGHFSNNIFIVHGRDDAMKQAVARSVTKLGLELIILHEQPNKGRTIIEKFEDYSDVGFAIVLLSGDDKGYLKSDLPKGAKLRARQNVIFEMGFFIGKLGRERVFLLLEQGVEHPSDIDGIVYTPYESVDGNWRGKLVQELKACGYDVDANKLF
jgi:predicted nucleotide-binding protein